MRCFETRADHAYLQLLVTTDTPHDGAIANFSARRPTTMTVLEEFNALMKRILKRRPKISLRHIHEHLIEMISNQRSLKRQMEQFMATTKERLDAIAAGIDAVSTQLSKAQAEIEAELARLRAIIEAGGNPADVEAALASVETKVSALAPVSQALDDINPDVPTP